MTEQNTNAEAGDQAAPVFRMQKLYVKDLSFENPNAPEVFFTQAEPKVDFNMRLKNKKKENDIYEISIVITATITDNKKGTTLFIVEIEHAAAFLLKNIPEEHMPMVLAVECPTTMFPYTRQVVSQLSVDGGYMPFLMEPVNFLALFQQAQQQQEQQPPQQ